MKWLALALVLPSAVAAQASTICGTTAGILSDAVERELLRNMLGLAQYCVTQGHSAPASVDRWRARGACLPPGDDPTDGDVAENWGKAGFIRFGGPFGMVPVIDSTRQGGTSVAAVCWQMIDQPLQSDCNHPAGRHRDRAAHLCPRPDGASRMRPAALVQVSNREDKT